MIHVIMVVVAVMMMVMMEMVVEVMRMMVMIAMPMMTASTIQCTLLTIPNFSIMLMSCWVAFHSLQCDQPVGLDQST